ncbi:hypothetical protein BCY88_30435 [Paraburkholderia fungorum]|uniref:Uncharacterized protein n=1 Tax=Paraburkholderia fungorum TaxID=134537 RepID=A0A3R7L9T3_9BURK|nr:hypothetical protein BCY88_30435 [Paraburkholderia fungorum]
MVLLVLLARSRATPALPAKPRAMLACQAVGEITGQLAGSIGRLIGVRFCPLSDRLSYRPR